jgi:hypothetical protein
VRGFLLCLWGLVRSRRSWIDCYIDTQAIITNHGFTQHVRSNIQHRITSSQTSRAKTQLG